MKKLSLIICLLIICNLVIKGLLMRYVPNSLSFQEISMLQFLKITPGIHDFSFRVINLAIGTLISVLAFYLIFKKTKNYLLSLSISLSISLSPWLIVMSGYLNPFPVVILTVILILALIPNNIKTFVFTCILLLAFRFFVVSHDLFSFNVFLIVPDLIKLFDLKILFFAGDPSSTMLRIPLSGFFYYLDIFAFFSGLYYFFSVLKNDELKTIINNLFLLGLLFFIVLPADLIFSLRGEMIFFWMSVMIGFGYYNFFSLLGKKHILLIFLLILIMSANFLFTAELLVNHFDKINSDDWTYAEQSTINYLLANDNRPVYITNQSDKLYRYWQFFKLRNMKVFEVDINLMKKICQNTQNICIAKESELSFFNSSKEKSTAMFGNDSDLPIYFVLPNHH